MSCYLSTGPAGEPIAGLALLAWDFGVVCAVSAFAFGAFAVLRARALPARPPDIRGHRRFR
ncbi:hypothetical protein [Streptomyces sp900116325]|uniref:hypothetical protein n=1 Tax=Streptomyces sp. 900116325 TaxID=3154295 RepID=UPI00332D72A7